MELPDSESVCACARVHVCLCVCLSVCLTPPGPGAAEGRDGSSAQMRQHQKGGSQLLFAPSPPHQLWSLSGL